MHVKKEPSNAQVLVLLVLLPVVSAVTIYATIYTIQTQREYRATLDRHIAQVTKSADAISSLYRYVQLASDIKPIAILPFEQSQPFGKLALVNKTQQLTSDYLPPALEPVDVPAYQGAGQLLVRPEVNIALRQLQSAAKAYGYYVMVRSAYRSYSDQKALWQASYGSLSTAEPGQSEHQTGLAVDINSSPPNCGEFCSLDYSTAIWLEKNAPAYGFILRYPANKTNITGYPHENWHFRYVGVDVAKAITESGLTLDEAHALFKGAQSRK